MRVTVVGAAMVVAIVVVVLWALRNLQTPNQPEPAA